MANLRSTNQTPEYDVPYAGEVPSAQDRLLTGNHVRNGNGSPAFSPEFYQQYKQNVYEIGMHRPQPAGHGSGMVFRQRKRPCWCVLLVIVAVALMAAGISLGVLFGVVKKAEMTDSELAGQAGDASRNTSQPTVVVLKNSSVTTQASPTRTQAPPQTPTPSPDASPTSGKDFIPGSRWGVNVRRFKAFWHPGDSRVLEVLLSNGTKLLAAGHKANDGTLRGLYSLSLIDGQRRTTRVRFMGPHNLASIILPDGTIVNLDWSSNNQDVECKVFQIPPPVTSLGGAAARELNRPTSHLATLQLGVHSYLLRQVSRIINEAATDPGGVVEDEPMNPASRRLCTPRLPVKVTKCGGQYPYDGAFVQGDVTLQNGATLPMAALPWRRDDDDDECYKGVREAAPNFYIPLPGYIDQTTSREIAGRFLHSASRWWGKVCEVVGSVLEVCTDQISVLLLESLSS
ncbi:hypothetical protein BaRGS_00017385 [Batillaria attramentaria]|uniref:Uncharacterized protein n=1 Tax=Batillaria attramentaria TaxID=370345 RepID=A0ABD0KWC1_9CAEN